METVVAILQARMGSTRLPGKVLRQVLGRPLLWYEIERLRRCRAIDKIVLATSDQPADNPLAEFGREMGLDVYRGAENDVLDRYTQAARLHDAGHIMRVTGDCPLIDPDICTRVVQRYFDTGADYVVTSQEFAEGLDCEVFSRRMLELAWAEARLGSEREHVTLFFHNNADRFQLHELENGRDDSWCRITVDEPEDFELVRNVLEALYPKLGPEMNFDDVRKYLDEHPEIQAINKHIVRNQGLALSLGRSDV